MVEKVGILEKGSPSMNKRRLRDRQKDDAELGKNKAEVLLTLEEKRVDGSRGSFNMPEVQEKYLCGSILRECA